MILSKAVGLLAVIYSLNGLSAQDLDCAPWAPVDPDPRPEHYQQLSAALVDVLQRSFAEHTAENKYLDNAFWGTDPANRCSWPGSLWEGMDHISLSALYTLSSIYERVSKVELWDDIDKIKNIWFGTSYGFFYVARDSSQFDLEQKLKHKSNFCRDMNSISQKYHAGQTCWRQITPEHQGGLHFCFGAGKTSSVHIDFNNPALGKLPFSDTCAYNPFKVLSHYQDLNGPERKTVFDQLILERKNVQQLLLDSRTQCTSELGKLYQQKISELLQQLDVHTLIPMALKGSAATQIGVEYLQKIKSELERIKRLKLCAIK